MPVLIEAISVIIKNEAIKRVFGGIDEFGEKLPNNTACTDSVLTKVGFMSQTDTAVFVRWLDMLGIKHINNGKCQEVVVLEQGLGVPDNCDWCKIDNVHHFEAGNLFFARYFRDRRKNSWAIPPNFDLKKGYQTQRANSIDELKERMEFVESDGAVETWRDKQNGKLYYIGRTTNLN